MDSKSRTKLRKKSLFNIALLLLFSLTMLSGALVMRHQIMKNAKTTGTLLLDNYCTNEENKLETFRTILTLGTKFIDEREQAGASIEEIKNGLYPYMSGFYDLYSGTSLRPIAIVNGNVISSDSEVENFDDGVYDYTSTDWYKSALEADGEIYISDAYSDYTTGKKLITLAKKAEHSDSMLLFDVFFEDYHIGRDALELPEDAAYYLCDTQGQVMYYDTSVFDSEADIQAFTDSTISQTQSEEGTRSLDGYTDAKGNKRSAYVQQLENGWTVILTIPHENATEGTDSVFLMIALIFFAGTAIVLYLALRDYRQSMSNQLLREKQQTLTHTAQIVQKTISSTTLFYRELYYIDLTTGEYQLIYPEKHSGKYAGRYNEILSRHFTGQGISYEDEQSTLEFLSIENIKKELAEKEYTDIRCRHISLDGVLETCSATITAADRVKGVPISATLAVRSIEKVLEQEESQRELLTLAVQRAESASHAKSDFLSNMSHDIRTPMNAILGMTAIAAMHIDEKERVADSLNKIAVSGKHLLGLINSVLDMSKIESGKITLNEENFNIAECMKHLIIIFKNEVSDKGINLKVSASKIEHENVIGDEQRLQQILINILGNGVKFTPSGGTISVTLEEKPSNILNRGQFVFTFEDTGIGMEEEFVGKIFEPFARAEDTRTTSAEGTGLGMPIARSIAQLMGGDIQVESTYGKGSKFTVTIYLKLDGAAKDDMLMLAGLPVLVADDEEYVCENACELLTDLGMKAEYVLSGDEAIAKVKAAHDSGNGYSVAILDWKMSGKNGIEAVREIRKIVGDEISVIILSAHDWSEIETEALSAGVNAFIEKPLFKSRLTYVLKEVLGISAEQGRKNLPEISENSAFSGKRVLLVEDNMLNIEVAQELLKTVGITSETANNGREAVSRLLEKPSGYYDLIFMDIQMPVMNGYEAAEAIRSSEREDLKTIPIVAMTADAFAEDVKRAKSAGMNAHISKPIDIAKIKNVLETWIE